MIHETSYTRARQQLATLMDQVTDTREPVLTRCPRFPPAMAGDLTPRAA
ncbi:hypothetical protein [Candidatus Rariloculus sp.]